MSSPLSTSLVYHLSIYLSHQQPENIKATKNYNKKLT